MRVPIILLVLGLLPAFVGPLPGLGVVLVMGGTVGFGFAFIKVVLGPEGELPCWRVASGSRHRDPGTATMTR